MLHLEPFFHILRTRNPWRGHPARFCAMEHGLQGAKTLREQETIGMSRGGMTAKLLPAVDEDGPPLPLRPDLRRSP